MEKILLIVPESNLRQLYHELFLSENIEVVPVEDTGSAILMLTLNYYPTAVIFIDQRNNLEIETFLSIRRKHPNMLKTNIILISQGESTYVELLASGDHSLNADIMTPEEIASAVKEFLKSA